MTNKTAVFSPARLQGELVAVPSKSSAHRKLICAALANEKTLVKNVGTSEDVLATMAGLTAMSVTITQQGEDVLVTPLDKAKAKTMQPNIHCRESGSTFRFLLPVALALFEKTTFTADGNLPNRPFSAFAAVLHEHGVMFHGEKLPFDTKGCLQSGIYEVPANISSQFISGLLLALPLLQGDSEIRFTTEVESQGYIDMTMAILNEYSIKITPIGTGYIIHGGQTFTSPKETIVEGDYSGAAFYLCGAALTGKITLQGLQKTSLQPDSAVIATLQKFGATVTMHNGKITTEKGDLKGIEVDATHIPDLIPILSVVAAKAEGETVFHNIARLRYKESDRAAAIVEMLQGLGVKTTLTQNTLTVWGQATLSGGALHNFLDHRIAMSIAIAGAAASEEITMAHPQVVAKSYPTFYEDYQKLNGRVSYV